MAKKPFDENNFESIEVASAWAQAHKITSFRKWWKARSKRPKCIPSDPIKYTAWKSWSDFLNTTRRKRNADFASYEDVKLWAVPYCFKHKIKSAIDWSAHWRGKKMPNDKYPKDPLHVFGEEFLMNGGWPGFIGKVRGFLSYSDATVYIQTLNIKNYADYRVWAKSENRPNNIPSSPHVFYKDEWVNYPIYLGYKKLAIAC
jgi:hypothetical protein